MFRRLICCVSAAFIFGTIPTSAGVKIGIGNQSISADSDGATNLIRPFDGLIDEVRVYSRGLSRAEMLSVAFGQ